MLAIRGAAGWQRRLYPSLQIFGGGVMIMTFVNQWRVGSGVVNLVAGGILAVIGMIGIVLGVRSLEGDRGADRWCFWFWLVQVLSFALPGASYSFFCGAAVAAVVHLMPIGLSLSTPRLGVDFVARIVQEAPTSYVGVNLVAIAASRYFWALWRRA